MKGVRAVFELLFILGLLFGVVITFPFWGGMLAVSWLGTRREKPHAVDGRGHYSHP